MANKFADVENLYKTCKDLKREDIEVLQEWLKMQPHLPQITELQLILFLHSCYYSIEAAKKSIDNFYTARTHCPEIFKNRDPRKFIKQCDHFFNTTLPQLTPEGYGMIYGLLINTDPKNYNFEISMKTCDMLMHLWLQEVGCIQGHVVLVDFAGSSFGHFTRINLMTLKKTLQYFQEGFPFRLKAIHFCNPPTFLDSVISLIKPTMSKELFNMIHVHQGKSITNIIPADRLPESIGGTVSTKELHEDFIKKLLENADYFVQDEKNCVDESKRQEKANGSAFFGVEGTFKKLDID
ncbi:PREDICTED: alpha-tocopherol transfer protein-like [Nicrophorus vespilloides]|uniref:Alpha-tocopherol transfer protein-like n=1 Tax=Nicrophorus vespilloides TaxID=110193 RepID=A0ABM1N3B9_NICVS|nr:PREDICTED: alpha-tocopherol transfer protein-like [Nicrophorus vespilloides]